MSDDVEVVMADLALPAHAEAVRRLTSEYAADAMGRGRPLEEEVLERLVPGLRALPTTLIFLALAGGEPIGIANCFRGFSTFHARPLVNIHDLAVSAGWRGKGVGSRLMRAVEEHARGLGCCKITLEVGTENARAQAIYQQAGFAPAAAETPAGGSLFYEKVLT